MSRVQLVVTGRCEELALHDSLRQLFPETEFLRPIRLDPFTSNPLTEPPAHGVRETAYKFAAKLVERVDTLEDTLVVGVEDQEFETTPALQVDVLRRAVLSVLAEPPSSSRRERLAQQVAERCSFHLLVPMVEAYFFGDPAALERAGAKRVSALEPSSRDVEAFLVEDAAFAAPADTDTKDDWCRGGALRAVHPKRYLKFLSGNGQPGNWKYRESRGGAAALRQLDWPRVAANPQFTQSARALVADVADWLNVSNPLPGSERELTARHTTRVERILRNA